MIHSLLNLCADSIFALCNCLYYLTWPYQNVINLIIISKCAFFDAVAEGLISTVGAEYDTQQTFWGFFSVCETF